MQEKTHLDNAWVAVQTRILYEKIAAEHLLLNGYECFLPLQYKESCRNTSIVKDKGTLPSVPFFPGYLFCRYKLRHSYPIMRASGVVRILGYDGNPAVIPDREIDAISKIVASGFSAEPQQLLRSEQKVRVNSGPLNGIEGYLISVLNKYTWKIAIGVSVVEQSVFIDVRPTDVCIIQQ